MQTVKLTAGLNSGIVWSLHYHDSDDGGDSAVSTVLVRQHFDRGVRQYLNVSIDENVAASILEFNSKRLMDYENVAPMMIALNTDTEDVDGERHPIGDYGNVLLLDVDDDTIIWSFVESKGSVCTETQYDMDVYEFERLVEELSKRFPDISFKSVKGNA